MKFITSDFLLSAIIYALQMVIHQKSYQSHKLYELLFLAQLCDDLKYKQIVIKNR